MLEHELFSSEQTLIALTKISAFLFDRNIRTDSGRTPDMSPHAPSLSLQSVLSPVLALSHNDKHPQQKQPLSHSKDEAVTFSAIHMAQKALTMGPFVQKVSLHWTHQ